MEHRLAIAFNPGIADIVILKYPVAGSECHRLLPRQMTNVYQPTTAIYHAGCLHFCAHGLLLGHSSSITVHLLSAADLLPDHL